ncbi:winged helix-turn-helix domain-containing protein [Streptomyces sp. SID13031]|uniref:ArsR/SmtB family transcription factor n=1 Tax=Streptomyces sp. SID13031 TaxID=2706046 RepID=UPI0013C929D2|nr:winged helix-turn-helix domain-containing protein [Streptomyces sp. SID13031]NEA33157.1 winged helix-turn-helix transcriptional regulator [Streptomyces sp. SID13031]
MLRVIFTEADLAQVRVAPAADPLWEIANSLDRLQTKRGRWAYAPWYRAASETLTDPVLRKQVTSLLLPLFPRAAYFPDFLTPPAALNGLEAGIDAILSTPTERVTSELKTLALVHQAPSWAPRLAAGDLHSDLGAALRMYHHRVIEPHSDLISAELAADRATRARALARGGPDRLLNSFQPLMRWRPPVLEVRYPINRTIHLAGRGLQLTPSYFCWQNAITLADTDLSPVLVYPVLRELPTSQTSDATAAALLGKTRAAILRATIPGRTAAEIATQIGIGAPTTSHHLTVLRDSGLITTQRAGKALLHVLTPLGAALLRQQPVR